MSLEALFEPLLRSELFGTMPPSSLKHVLVAAERRAYSQGRVIVEAGQICDAAILIARGTVGPSDAAGLEGWGPGAMISELAMVTETVAAQTLVAQQQVHALAFPRSAISQLFSQHPEIAEHVTSVMVSRLDGLASALRDADAALARLELTAA